MNDHSGNKAWTKVKVLAQNRIRWRQFIFHEEEAADDDPEYVKSKKTDQMLSQCF